MPRPATAVLARDDAEGLAAPSLAGHRTLNTPTAEAI